jgi:energy-coupling factor transporter ATP-binding protein EcfA2
VLEDLRVQGYTAFRDLTIDHLGRVNLVVGRNNVGKSSLLEALWLYARRGAPDALIGILEARDERRYNPADADTDEVNDWTAFRNLFYGRGFRVDDVPGIYIGPLTDPSQLVSMEVVWFAPSTAPDGITRWDVIPTPSSFERTDYRRGIRVRLGADVQGRIWLDYAERPGVVTRRGWTTQSPSGQTQEIPCSYILTDPARSDLVSEWWDRVALTQYEDYVIRALRIVEPDLERIAFVTISDRYPRSRIPVAKISETPHPVTLKSLGDGMVRIFTIALALATARNGIVLLDEVENGIHYTVQPDLWRLIFSMAKELNLQVFATSHSWDCIEAFQRVSSDDDLAEGVLVRLDRRRKNVLATIFTELELAIATRDRIEVR